ncbi:hypothetical protein N7517_009940 [Penicillium concentricum]|uniref:Uncharacterized protein n=1 Tax=Penicillium concentricum TaxID=293559 RepID=A0A9W9RK53_9EURO|nr:uncharacterized protein N7517_009940 [Penicillium concentricum]KAJ5360749.1 hypothetical protein N7517_009940 [Penicillium concentricum]
MAAHHASRVKIPPAILENKLSLARRLPELSEPQLRECLDHTIRDNCDIRHFYDVMLNAISSNKVYLVKELLRYKLPISPIYILEAINAKAKDILASFFDNGWDINTLMSGMEPPILTYADLLTVSLLLYRSGDIRIGQLIYNAIHRKSDTLKVVEILINRGAPFNSLLYQDHQYSQNMFPFMTKTPLHTVVALS